MTTMNGELVESQELFDEPLGLDAFDNAAGRVIEDGAVFLDAETLAEGGIGQTYVDKIVPALAQLGFTALPVTEHFDYTTGDYRVECNGVDYQVTVEGEEVWVRASWIFFDIVNRQLPGHGTHLWATGCGEDLCGVWLTSENVDNYLRVHAPPEAHKCIYVPFDDPKGNGGYPERPLP